MWTAFPPSDYYAGSATPRANRRRVFPHPAWQVGERGAQGASQVHRQPIDRVGAQLCPCDLATGTPQSFPMASFAAKATAVGVAQRLGVRRFLALILRVRAGAY